MRYSEIDLQIEDIMWFAVDNDGHIGAFTSGGSANVPEFVCKSRENNEKLYNYFMYFLPDSTCGDLIRVSKNSYQEEDCVLLIGKGLTCFDVHNDTGQYAKIAKTKEPITISDLDDVIVAILKDNKLDADFVQDNIIKVEHAY